MPVIVHGVTVPPTDTASNRDSAIGDTLVKAAPKSLQDFPSSDRSDTQSLSYVAESCRPAGVWDETTQRLIPLSFRGLALCRLSDGQHSFALV
jgi:hypothetical protein